MCIRDSNEALTKCSIEGIPNKDGGDELYETAVEMVLTEQRGSTTFLQRQLEIGYTRASRLIEAMEEQGLVGPHVGSKQRDVYYTFEEYQDRVQQAMEDEQGSDDGGEDTGPGTEEPGGAADTEQGSDDSGDNPDEEQPEDSSDNPDEEQ